MNNPQSQIIQLTIDRDGSADRDHIFVVSEPAEIADYVRNALGRFFQDYPDVSLDTGITLTIGKAKRPLE